MTTMGLGGRWSEGRGGRRECSNNSHIEAGNKSLTLCGLKQDANVVVLQTDLPRLTDYLHHLAESWVQLHSFMFPQLYEGSPEHLNAGLSVDSSSNWGWEAEKKTPKQHFEGSNTAISLVV